MQKEIIALRIALNNILAMGKLEAKNKTASRLKALDNAMLSLVEAEKQHILKILEIFDYNITKASEVLKCSRSTLYRKMEEYKILRP